MEFGNQNKPEFDPQTEANNLFAGLEALERLHFAGQAALNYGLCPAIAAAVELALDEKVEQLRHFAEEHSSEFKPNNLTLRLINQALSDYDTPDKD